MTGPCDCSRLCSIRLCGELCLAECQAILPTALHSDTKASMSSLTSHAYVHFSNFTQATTAHFRWPGLHHSPSYLPLPPHTHPYSAPSSSLAAQAKSLRDDTSLLLPCDHSTVPKVPTWLLNSCAFFYLYDQPPQEVPASSTSKDHSCSLPGLPPLATFHIIARELLGHSPASTCLGSRTPLAHKAFLDVASATFLSSLGPVLYHCPHPSHAAFCSDPPACQVYSHSVLQ